jgi:hypothetical protein
MKLNNKDAIEQLSANSEQLSEVESRKSFRFWMKGFWMKGFWILDERILD